MEETLKEAASVSVADGEFKINGGFVDNRSGGITGLEVCASSWKSWLDE